MKCLVRTTLLLNFLATARFNLLGGRQEAARAQAMIIVSVCSSVVRERPACSEPGIFVYRENLREASVYESACVCV